MASITLGVTALVSSLVTIFHKPILEILSRPIPVFKKESIDSVKESVTETFSQDKTVVKTKKFEPKVDGDYVDSAWSDAETPRRAFEVMESVPINKETARTITNTCKKLLEYYAMEHRRRKQLEDIRDKLIVSFPDLAKEIDMGLFSQCSFWEGKIVLYR